jgi:RHS repeat-associated protein
LKTLRCALLATNSDYWTPATNGASEWIVLNFATVTVADGIVIKEAAGTAGNGFITRIDLIESGGTAHTVFSGTDPVKLDGYLRITFPLTSYNVAKVKIFVNGQIHSTVLPAIDSVELRRHSVSTTVNASPVETKFTLDGWNPAKGYAIGLENVDVWTENIVGTSTKTHYTRGDRVDQLLGRVDANGTFWMLTDKLGSVRGVVDNGGILAAQVDYDAFGNIIGSFQNPNITTAGLGRYGWTGREIETELGLQYNRARYYDPAMGRWISKDPMGFAAGDSNLYRYVKNAPTNYRDPSGFDGEEETQAYWQKQAEDLLLSSWAPGKDLDYFIKGKASPGEYVVLNRMIVSKWATLYLDEEHNGKNQSRFLWMGAAAFASVNVGKEIQRAYRACSNARHTPGTAAEIALSVNRLRLQLLGGTNAAVYKDLYWQHLAYEKGGIELLKKIKGIDGASLAAWTKIAKGEAERNPGLIAAGNLDLLNHEQTKIVQKHAFDAGGKPATIVAAMQSSLGVRSPIPGGKGFPNNLNIAVPNDRLTWMPQVMDDFNAYIKNTPKADVEYIYKRFMTGWDCNPLPGKGD